MKGLADLLERAGWTAVQAFIGVLASVNLAGEGTDWKVVLTSAAIAALVSALKVLGVKGYQVTAFVTAAKEVPAVEKWTETNAVGRTSEDFARKVARELTERQ